MEKNQRNENRDLNTNDRMNREDNMRNEQNKDNMNTASGLRSQSQREQDMAGSGRSYDYGTEGSTEENMNQQLGRNSNQQDVSNPINPSGGGATPNTGRSDSRAGSGSGMTPKQSITGSDTDGQNL